MYFFKEEIVSISKHRIERNYEHCVVSTNGTDLVAEGHLGLDLDSILSSH